MNELTVTRPDVAKEIAVETDEPGTTIVHCLYDQPSLCRLWPAHMCIIQDNGDKRRLVHSEGIALHPYWDYTSRFTLVFEGLAKSCSSFYLFEDIPESGAFKSATMQRNKTDVYTWKMQ